MLLALFFEHLSQREAREAPGDVDRHSDPGRSAQAHQVRHFSPRPRLSHSPDLILDRPRRSRKCDITAVSDSPRNASPARGPRGAPSAASGPSSGGPSRANSPDPLQARLEAMRAEERRLDALLRAKQQDFQAIHDRVRAEEARAQREALQHQRDVIAFQAEADRLSQEHQDRMAHFQREEWPPPSAHGFSKTITLGVVAPRRHAPWRVLHQPQRPRPIKQRKRPAVTLDSLNIDSLPLPLALTLPSTQVLQNLRRA